MFWFKRKKLVVDCFTDKGHAYELAPIQPAIKFIPSWWKALPKTFPSLGNRMSPDPTMKSCAGFIEQYKQGIIMPLWTDGLIDIGPEGTDGYRWEMADGVTEITSHPEEQRGTYLPNSKYQHLKIVSPWLVQTKEDVYWQYMQPMYNFNQPDHIIGLPGVMNFKYQQQTHINLIFTRIKDKVIRHALRRGQPMTHLIPFTERELDLRLHLVDKAEIERINACSYHSTFYRSYQKMVKIRKDREKEKKCPFHF